MHADIDRSIYLEGAANFRDLGGYPAASGAMVRRGRIFRSDAMHRLTASDLSLLESCKFATLIDLRSEAEVARTVASPLVATGVRYRNIPIWDIDGPENEQTNARLLEQYVSMLRNCGPAIRDIFGALAESSTCPAVIHCSAGKDRTGITSALILGSIGVEDEAIIADYAMTDANVARIIVLGGDAYYDPPDNPSPLMRAHPETMTGLLAAITTEWGSIPGYLTRIGVTERERAAIADQMLER
jgi:protein tyrosine/serine phosphatase